MPKKRTLNLRQFQGTSSASSSNRGSAGQDGGDSPTASVNERLSDLRMAESFEATQKKRELAEQATHQRTVPPELRSILGVPESAPPRPKAGARLRDREAVRMSRRTPGPAAPKSWLGFQSAWEESLSLRDGKRKVKRSEPEGSKRNRPQELMRFARLTADPRHRDDFSPTGLLHLTLKRLAEHWDDLDEEDYPALLEIPARLRLTLLSYLGVYGPPINSTAFQALLLGADNIASLDLGGLAGHAPLTMRRFARLAESLNHVIGKDSADELVESWDAEESSDVTLPSAPSLPTFMSVTQICLSHPPPTVSWRDLLSSSKHLPHVTHLSLAYWPRPTLTPNLATATVSSQNSPEVRAGGTHYYSNLDQDYSEAATLLRQLSSHLLCLQWLDLEGCAEWIPALSTLAAAASLTVVESEPQEPAVEADAWTFKPPVMTMFADTWRNLNYIRCAQGWLPSSIGIEALGAADPDVRKPLLKYLEKHEDMSRIVTNDLYETRRREARIWDERESKVMFSARRINTIRRARSCKPVMWDFGWVQKHVS